MDSVRWLGSITRAIPRRRKYLLTGAAIILVLAVVSVIGVLTETPLLLVATVSGLVVVAVSGSAAAYRRIVKLLIATRDATLIQAAQIKALAQPLANFPNVFLPRIGASEWMSVNRTITTRNLVNRLTQMRSTSGRDILAFYVTRGMWDWSDLERALECYRLGGIDQNRVQTQLDAFDPLPAVQLADLCFRQNVTPMDRLNAASLYRIILQQHGERFFESKRRAEYRLDSFASSVLREEGLQLLKLYAPENKRLNDVELFRANFTNPFRYGDGADLAEWLDCINAMYRREGLAELVLLPGEGDPFLRLSATATVNVTEGPLVSILMPVFQPDVATGLAISSALAQSYRNIELIIVDDGSGAAYTDELRSWADQDPRVTVVLNPVNAGAYTARNIAFAKATGEYVTVFDGDDWQHPQKIDKLVAAAMARTDDRMVSTPWARVDSDLYFHYRGWRGAFITPAHVSTMFPVSVVREKLGNWDSVRKAADAEFILRYQLVVNSEDSLEATEAPLTLSLVGAANLSVDDFRLGFRAPDRGAYREAFAVWHNRIKAGTTSGYLPFPLMQRPFAAPPRYLPIRSGTLKLDVLLVGDFGANTPATELMLTHLMELRAGTFHIGLMHQPSLIHSDALDGGFSEALLDAFTSGDLQRVEVTDTAVAATVIVYDPAGFQFATALASQVRAKDVVILAERAPLIVEGHHYDITAVTGNIQNTFGVSPQWIPMHEGLYKKLLGLLPAGSLLERTWAELEHRLRGDDDEAWPSASRLAAVGIYKPVLESANAKA